MGDVFLNEDAQPRWMRLNAYLSQRPGFALGLRLVGGFLTILFYIAYGLLLVMAFLDAPVELIPLITVPSIGFITVSLWRSRINAPRPYEDPSITALIPREGTGCSFPSRHGFSSFTIAFCWAALNPSIALGLGICAILLGLCRLIGGVHYPEDILAGAGLGIACGTVASFSALVIA